MPWAFHVRIKLCAVKMERKLNGTVSSGDVMCNLDNAQNYLRVRLVNVTVDCSVGIHPWEQFPERPNRLVVNVDMYCKGYADAGGFAGGGIVDYDPIRSFIVSWSQRPHTPYLEALAEALIVECFRDARVDAVCVSILKPGIFNETAGAGIEIFRKRS